MPTTPSVENDGFLRPHPLDRLTIPRSGQAGDGAQLGLVGHAMAADELPALRANDAVQRLAKIETLHQTFERKVARHDEGNERLLRFGTELLSFLLVRLRAGLSGVPVFFFDGLALRLPHRFARVIVLHCLFVLGVELLLVLL
jgi:hypothetical protein